MRDKGLILGEKFLKEGLNKDIIRESQELDIIIVHQQRALLEKYIADKEKENYKCSI